MHKQDKIYSFLLFQLFMKVTAFIFETDNRKEIK